MDPELNCPSCGYDLQSLGGKAATRCPECGQVPRWRPAQAAFHPSQVTWLGGISTLGAIAVAWAVPRPPGGPESATFLAAFAWSWGCIGTVLAAGYWRSGRLPAVVHGVIVGGVLALIWAAACFVLIEWLHDLLR